MKRISVISLFFCVVLSVKTTLGQESVGKMEDIEQAEKTKTAEVTRQAGPTGSTSSIVKKDSVRTRDIILLLY